MNLLNTVYSALTGNMFPDRELRDVRNEISFEKAIEAHLAWKRRLFDQLSSNHLTDIHPDDIRSDAKCEVGAWIYGHGRKRYGELNSFQKLREEHARFHEIASEVVRLAQSNRKQDAQELLDTEFRRSSSYVTDHLRHLSSLFGEVPADTSASKSTA